MVTLAAGVDIALTEVVRLVTFKFVAREVLANSNVKMARNCMFAERAAKLKADRMNHGKNDQATRLDSLFFNE